MVPRLRREAGYSQRDLQAETGIPQRVIAYYEIETKHPPAHLLEPLAKALKVSVEELLGIKAVKEKRDPQQAALWRRLRKAEELPKGDKKALLHYLDALVKKNSPANSRA